MKLFHADFFLVGLQVATQNLSPQPPHTQRPFNLAMSNEFVGFNGSYKLEVTNRRGRPSHHQHFLTDFEPGVCISNETGGVQIFQISKIDQENRLDDRYHIKKGEKYLSQDHQFLSFGSTETIWHIRLPRAGMNPQAFLLAQPAVDGGKVAIPEVLKTRAKVRLFDADSEDAREPPYLWRLDVQDQK